jgi:hypothetical protein
MAMRDSACPSCARLEHLEHALSTDGKYSRTACRMRHRPGQHGHSVTNMHGSTARVLDGSQPVGMVTGRRLAH